VRIHTLAAVLALHVVSVAWLLTILRNVTLLSAVLAGTTTTSLAWVGAVAVAMAFLIAVAALDDRLLELTLLLWALLGNVAELCITRSASTVSMSWMILYVPLQLLHFGIMPSIGKPASARRVRFSSGVDGHPSESFARFGLAENWMETVYFWSRLPCKLTIVWVSETCCSLAIK
jgi:hypothetical protein